MSDLRPADVYASPVPPPPPAWTSFLVDRDTVLTVRTAAFRLGVDGPVYAHVDLMAGRYGLRLHLYDACALRLLATALYRLVDDRAVLFSAPACTYPAPKARTLTTSPSVG